MKSKRLLTRITAFFAVALVLLFQSAFGAQPRREFNVQGTPEKDLIHESQTLKLTDEQSIQTDGHASSLKFGFMAGAVQTNAFSVTSQGHQTDYQAMPASPFLTALVSATPGATRIGKWGGMASISYGYLEQHDQVPATSLHIVPLELALLYRGEWKEGQKLIPYAAIGADDLIYFQRGLEQYNTSDQVLATSWTAGLSFNLNQIFGWRSRVLNEAQIQYRSILPANNSDSGWKMDIVQIGSSFSL